MPPVGCLNVTSKEAPLIIFPPQIGSSSRAPSLRGAITSLPRPGTFMPSLTSFSPCPINPQFLFCFILQIFFSKFSLFCRSPALPPQCKLHDLSPARASYVTECALTQSALPPTVLHAPAGVMVMTCKSDEVTLKASLSSQPPAQLKPFNSFLLVFGWGYKCPMLLSRPWMVW